MSRLWRLLRLVVATLGGVWSLLMMLVMAGSLALSVAMTVLPGLFAAVAGVVETVTGARTLASRAAAREAQLTRSVAQAERRAVAATRQADDTARALAASRSAERRLAGELAESRAAQTRLARELADSPVTYRGARMAARDAVADTAGRVSRRTAAAATRSVGSAFGEALPFAGIAVVAAATAYDVSESCQLMREMHELDIAFNPQAADAEANQVCGMAVPTRAEILDRIRHSPAAVWDSVQAIYADLPDVSFSDGWGAVMGWAGGVYDQMFGSALPDAPASVPAVEMPPPVAPDEGGRTLNPFRWGAAP